MHQQAVASELDQDPLVVGAIIYMYGKCGYIEAAKNVFSVYQSHTTLDIKIYNAMILAYGTNGAGTQAIQTFEVLLTHNIQPDSHTFVNLISACAHSGLKDAALKYYLQMQSQFRIIFF